MQRKPPETSLPRGLWQAAGWQGAGRPALLGYGGLALLSLSFPLSGVPSGKLALMRRSDSWENIVTKRKRTCLAPGKKKKRGGNIDVQWNAFYTLFQDQTALSRNDDVKDQQQLLLRPYMLYIRQVCALLQHICNKRINLILFPQTGPILRRDSTGSFPQGWAFNSLSLPRSSDPLLLFSLTGRRQEASASLISTINHGAALRKSMKANQKQARNCWP